MNESRQGLTYGKIMLIMLAFIVVIVGAAFLRQFFVGPAIGFDDVPFNWLASATYDQEALDSSQLQRFDPQTPAMPGTLVYARTSEGNLAKLTLVFANCLIDPQNLKLRINNGTVYSPDGAVLHRIGGVTALCVDLDQNYDLDQGSDGARASDAEADLRLIYRSQGLQIIQPLNNSGLYLPSSDELSF